MDKNKVLLLEPIFPEDALEFEENIEEMKALIDTKGGEVIEVITQKREKPDPGYFFGKGKLDEAKQFLENFPEINVIVVDAFLSPVQQRNLETFFGKQIIDREELILEIFAQNAETKEAKLQVEMAQLKYLLPRLRNLWPHLTSQQGGFGFRGPGETQLEMDRRNITKKIAILREKLKHVERVRATQRRGRRNFFKVSIVGYTNAGKSSLLTLLSGKDLYVANKLFATLDTATKKIFLGEGGKVLISDTVGFIKKLPPQLIAAFKSTLEELKYADLIMHVVDISSPSFEKKIAVVEQIMSELEANDKNVLFVFNKIDLLDEEQRSFWENKYKNEDNVVFISVKEKVGIEELKEKIISFSKI